MCTVSMIQEHYTHKWNQPPGWSQPPQFDWSGLGGTPLTQQIPSPPSPEEIAEFRSLLERARKYDKQFSQPDCELEAKKELLHTMAEKWGIDISFIDKET